jgi:hypothetical protein
MPTSARIISPAMVLRSGALWAIHLTATSADLNPGPAVHCGDAPKVEDAVIVDIDGDGAADVVSATESRGERVIVHFAPADRAAYARSDLWQTVAFPQSVVPQSFWMYCLPMDVNADGRIDLVIGSKQKECQVGWIEAPAGDRRDLSGWSYHRLGEAGWIMSLIAHDWDVINENYKHNHIVSIVGHDAVADWFHWAKQASGGSKLFWNEIHVLPDTQRGREVRDYTEARLQNLLALGAPVDGLGIQGHHGVGTISPPEQTLAYLDRFAKLGLEIQFTEFDVNVPDPADPAQSAFQADYVRDFMTVAFSHPSVTGVIYWTPFPYKWLPNSALTDAEYKLRRHGQVWRELVTTQWWTNATGLTDADGAFATRVFRGEYRVTVHADGRTVTRDVTLGGDGQTLRIVAE